MIGVRSCIATSATFAALVSLCAATSQQSARPARSISIDHVVLAVNDLEAAAARYRQLGFALKPGRPHDNGIRNQHVKFTDGTELELLTAPAATDQLTSAYRAHLANGDGPKFLSLFPRPTAPKDTFPFIFFGQGNRSPTDRPEHFAHANTARTLAAVWLAGSRDLAGERALLARYGATIRPGRLAPIGSDADVAQIDGGLVYLLPDARRLRRDRPIVGVTFAIGDLGAARRVLTAAQVPFTDGAGWLLLAPPHAHGLWVEFRGTATPAHTPGTTAADSGVR